MTPELFIGNRAIISPRAQLFQSTINRRPGLSYEPSSSKQLVPFRSSAEAVSEVAADEAVAVSSGVSLSPQPSADLFDLRQDIMRYTNPLRAKVLLFSLLYRPLQMRSTEEALLLKSHRLDQLLEATLHRYTHYEQLAAHLKQTARKLDDPVEYDQVSYAILRAVKTYYSQPHAW